MIANVVQAMLSIPTFTSRSVDEVKVELCAIVVYTESETPAVKLQRRPTGAGATASV